MKMTSKPWISILLSGLLIAACNVNEQSSEPPINPPLLTESGKVKDDQFQEFLKYFEKINLPVEIVHHIIVNEDPIPRALTFKFLSYGSDNGVHAVCNIPIAKNHIALVVADEPFEGVIYHELYIFDQAGNRLSSRQIAGKDDSWLGRCVFGDNGEFRVETRTPDMYEDETEPLSVNYYHVTDEGKIEELDSE
jgi:hypothetical protein